MKLNATLLLSIIALFCTVSSTAQISSSGSPLLISDLKSTNADLVKTHIYSPNSSTLLKGEASMKMGDAITFAHAFDVNYTPANSGKWTIVNNVRIWTLEIASPGAESINLIFDRYILPEGAQLFIYNKNFTDIKGAFTSFNNKETGILATSPVLGDTIIVEYQEPLDVEFEGELLIGSVNHDYIGIYDYDLKVGNIGDSGSCNEDVSCSDLDGIEDLKRSVVRMIVSGTEYCTATLVNNTSNDGTPYALTAGHCFGNNPTGTAVLFLFNYESPHCSGYIDGSKVIQTDYLSLAGSALKCYVKSMDIALIELSEVPPSYYRPYYAGWSLNDVPSKPFSAIHHPSGDVKKVSTSILDLNKKSFNTPSFEADFHWEVEEWETGTTEGGSSGCGLFDSNNLLVGTLSGGAASCFNSVFDYFVRFNKAWDGSSDISQQLKTYLDPLNTGNQSTEGFDPYGNNNSIRISNVEDGENPSVGEILNDGGYIAGHNSAQIIKYAEKFDNIKSATIKGLYVMPSVYDIFSSQKVSIGIWTGDTEPMHLQVQRDYEVSDLTADKELYVDFGQDIDILGTFFISYSLEYSESGVDTFSMYHSGLDILKSNNTMMVYEGGNWKMASEFYNTQSLSLWIDVVASNVEWGDTAITPNPDEIEITVSPNPFDSNVIYVRSYDEIIETYEVFDLNGVKHITNQLNLSGGKVQLDLPNLAAGVYVLKLHTNKGTSTHKIIKSN